jgi:hypothetical protein
MFAVRPAGPMSLRLVCATMATSLLLALPSTSQADHVDDELIKNAEALVKALQEKGYKNVGVIKFMVKRGNDALSPNVGAINMNMATRVENALLYGMDAAKPLGVIRDATQVAATADPKMSVKTAAGRSALFKHSYPLAWGKDKVTADVFLTGSIDLSVDMKSTRVEIGYFDKKDDKIHNLLAFTVKTDRSILADAGQSFALAKRSLKKARSLEELDDEAAKSASDADKGKPINDQVSGEVPVKFEIFYDGKPQTLTPDTSSPGEFTVTTPQKGQTVTFQLTNTAKGKIGVVVKVNGESTINQEITDDSGCLKWILAPDGKYGLRGFYTMPDKTLAPFKVLDDEESKARMAEWAGSRPRAGSIDVTVFTENPDGPEEMSVGRTLRGLPPPKARTMHPKTAKDAHTLVRQISNTKRSRGLIVAGDQKENVNLQEDQLKNATQSYQMHINYYKPPTAP